MTKLGEKSLQAHYACAMIKWTVIIRNKQEGVKQDKSRKSGVKR